MVTFVVGRDGARGRNHQDEREDRAEKCFHGASSALYPSALLFEM